MKLCKIDDCNRTTHAKGWCRRHYEAWRRYADPLINKGAWKGGIRRHFMYGAWAGMVNRCHNQNNSSYDRYGAKGIYVCDRWRDFRNFLADMGERPDGMTLDRINVLGPYAPENCRWADAKTQRANISTDGDRRMRDAISAGVKASWDTRRGKLQAICVQCGLAFKASSLRAKICSRRCESIYDYEVRARTRRGRSLRGCSFGQLLNLP